MFNGKRPSSFFLYNLQPFSRKLHKSFQFKWKITVKIWLYSKISNLQIFTDFTELVPGLLHFLKCGSDHKLKVHQMLETNDGYLRVVHTDRVKRSSIGQFLRTCKKWSVRKFSILLRFKQVWTSLIGGATHLSVSIVEPRYFTLTSAKRIEG